MNPKIPSFFNSFIFSFLHSFILLISLPLFVSSQTNSLTKLDSLNHILKTATHDTTRAATLIALTEELAATNPDTVIPLCQQALAIIEKHVPNGSEGTHANKQEKHSYLVTKAAAHNNIGYIYMIQGQFKDALEYYGRSLKIKEDIEDKQGIATSLSDIGLIYKNQGKIKEALEYYDRSLKIQEDIEDKQGIATSLNNIAVIYDNQGQIKEALEYFGRSLKIYEDIGDKQGIATTLNNIGLIYMNQGQIKEALEYYGRSLKIFEDIGDKQRIAISLNNIGAIYMNQAEALSKRGASPDSIGRQIKEINPVEHDSLFNRALEYYGRSLKIREDIGDKQGIAMSLNNIGYIYNNQAEALSKRGASPGSIGRQIKEVNPVEYDSLFNRALEYYGRSLKICEGIGNKQGITYSLNNIGAIYFKEKDLTKAKVYADSSLKVANELGYPANIRDAAKLYADVYKAGSNYKDGWEMYEIYVVMRDSVKNKENEKAAIRQHTRYEFEKAMLVAEQEKKERQRQEAVAVGRRNMLQYSGILLTLVFMFMGIFLLARRFRKIKEHHLKGGHQQGDKVYEQYLKIVEAALFVSFLILFEFILVFLDPYLESITGGVPAYKLLANAVLAGVIFPLHKFLEAKLRASVMKGESREPEDGSQKQEENSSSKTLLLIVGFMFISLLNISSSDKLDSLNTALQTATHDTTRAATLVALTEELAASNPDTVIPLCQQAIAIIESNIENANKQEKHSYLITKAAALNNIGYIYDIQGQRKEALEYYGRGLKIQEDIGDKQGIASSLNNIGAIYMNQGQIKEALEYFGRGLKIQEDIGDKLGIASSLNHIGYIYNNQGQIKEALEYFGRGLKICEDIGDKKGIAASLSNIGGIYTNQGQIKEALEYHGRSLKICEDIGNKQGIAYSLNDIGYIYNNQAEALRKRGASSDSIGRQIQEALEYFGRSLKIWEDIGYKQGVANSLNNIGYIYNNQAEALSKRGASPDSIGRQIKKALEYHGRSLKIKEDIGDKQGITYSLNNIGSIYLKEKELAKAKEYADSSLNIANELGFPAEIRNAAKLYANVYKAGSNYQSGWEMYELYVVMRDSVKNKENEKAAIRQHTRFEFEKAMIVKEQQEEEIKRLEAEAVSRRNTLQYSSIFLALIFLFGMVFFLTGISMPEWLIELSTFAPFMILFEFTLVLMDPYIDNYTGGEPLYKLLINALWAAVIFPIHSFFEKKLKNRISEIKRKKDEQFAEEFRKEVEEIEHSK